MSSVRPKWGSWSIPPQPIAPEDVREVLETDVAILGAGIAGVTCALRTAESGASVIVLEKGASWSGRGGNIGVAASSFMKANGIENNFEELVREWIKRCGNRCDERLVWLFFNHSAEAMDWLIDIVSPYGARPVLQGSAYQGDTYREYYGSHRFFDGPMAQKGMRAGAADAVYAMFNESLKLGVEYLFKTPAAQILKEDGKVTGVYAKKADGGYVLVRARSGVVIATGDIGGNAEMCEDLSPLANHCPVKYTAGSGDGHRLGLWAGGSLEDPPFPMILHSQAYHFSNFCFLFVKPDGTRFMNEDNYVQGKCLAILRERASHAWSIVDSAWAEKVPGTLKYGGGIAWGQDFVLGEPEFDVETEQKMFERGFSREHIVSADTPEELAEKMGVPVEAFVETLSRYNALCASGRDEDFGKRKELLIPIDKPPYYGLKYGPAVLAVVGGLRVDTNMRVLDEDGAAVEGLYAIGNAAGGRYGVDYPLIICGNSHGTALTFGYLLGAHLGGAR